MLIVLLNVQNLLGWLYFLISESVSAWYVYLIAKSLLSVCLLVLSPTYRLVSASDLVPALSYPALFTFDPPLSLAHCPATTSALSVGPGDYSSAQTGGTGSWILALVLLVVCAFNRPRFARIFSVSLYLIYLYILKGIWNIQQQISSAAFRDRRELLPVLKCL